MGASLIIAYYNGSKFIREALRSASQQTKPFDEIILVDDGSTEAESKYVEELVAAEYPGVIFIKKKNGGQGDARNFGARQSTSECICFLDQDDTLNPEHNSVLSDAIVKQPLPKGWVFGNFNTIDSFGNVISRSALPGHSILNVANIYDATNRDLFILPSASMIDKNTFFECGAFDSQFTGYEDDDLFLRLYLRGANYNYVDRPVYNWRMHENQTSGSMRMCFSRLRFVKKWCLYNFGGAVDVEFLRLGIFLRFRGVLVKDVIRCDNKENLKSLKNVLKEYILLAKESKVPLVKVRVPLLIVLISPLSLSKTLVNLYGLFKRR